MTIDNYGKRQGITLEWIEREHFRYTEKNCSFVFTACGHPRDVVLPVDGMTLAEFKHMMRMLLAADADAEENMRFHWYCSDGHMMDVLERALEEDIGTGDVTSNAVIPQDAMARFVFKARQDLVVCGLRYLELLFWLVDPCVKVVRPKITPDERVSPVIPFGVHGVYDGVHVVAGTELRVIEGPARALLAGERTALNLVQQLSGVATLTRQYVDAVAGTGVVILDTRKTIPGLRAAQKYAVRCGGGQNHRMGLYDAILIKDNHIAVAGGVAAAVQAAKVASGLSIEVECDTLAQLGEALAAGVDTVLLDNMTGDQLRESVARVKAHNAASGQSVKTEASGNVSLATVRGIAETGVDFISIGKLTHSASAVDIGLDEV